MLSRRSVLVLPCLALLAPTALRADEPKKAGETKVEGDLKAMQGVWVSKDDEGHEATWTFKGDKLSLDAGDRQYEITVRLDEEAKPYKAMDMKVGEDSPNAKGANGLAIYKLEGDEAMTICFAPNETRPTEFKTNFPESFSYDLKKKKEKTK